MFQGCSGLVSLDLGNFDTSKVTNMVSMFMYCDQLFALNLLNFDISNVNLISQMFYGCTNLSLIYITSLWDASNVYDSVSMFENCYSLPNYDYATYDVSMAKPTTEGGYLTLV